MRNLVISTNSMDFELHKYGAFELPDSSEAAWVSHECRLLIEFDFGKFEDCVVGYRFATAPHMFLWQPRFTLLGILSVLPSCPSSFWLWSRQNPCQRNSQVVFDLSPPGAMFSELWNPDPHILIGPTLRFSKLQWSALADTKTGQILVVTPWQSDPGAFFFLPFGFTSSGTGHLQITFKPYPHKFGIT